MAFFHNKRYRNFLLAIYREKIAPVDYLVLEEAFKEVDIQTKNILTDAVAAHAVSQGSPARAYINEHFPFMNHVITLATQEGCPTKVTRNYSLTSIDQIMLEHEP